MRPIFLGYAENGHRLELGTADLATHVHGVGASRSGKSKMIECIVRQLVQNGEGFCLIDPHGFLYDDILRWLAYMKPRREIELFNPSFDGRVVGFNPFSPAGGDVGVQVERRIQAIVKVWGQEGTDQTPRLERWLRCLFHTLIAGGFPMDVARYLLSWNHREIREFLVRAIPSDLVRGEWDELDAYKQLRDFAGQIESTRNRLFRFLDPLRIRRIVGLPTNNLDLEAVMEQGKVLLVNLKPSAWLTDQHAQLLGALLLNELWEVASRRRRGRHGQAPRRFFVILDELQKFLTPDIPAMLDQAAKYGVHLLLFHQHLTQLREGDPLAYASVMTNARVKLVFGGSSRDDAIAVTREIFPGQIDLTRIKFLIEQTKFWPVYTRERVVSSARGGADVAGSGVADVSGMAWDPGAQDWIPTSATSSSATSAHADTWSEGIADVPFLYPVPFKEVSSIQPYSLEETIWELADRLMVQYQRHFMCSRPGENTVAAVTPFVRSYHVRPERLDRYVEQCLANYLVPAEVDKTLAEIHIKLLKEASVQTVDLEPDDFFSPLDHERNVVLK